MSIASRLLKGPVIIVTLALSGGPLAVAEIPDQTQQQLERSATHTIVGKVAHTYSRMERTDRVEHTYRVAEIVVETVRKGDYIQAGDRVFVRYWGKRWIGEGQPEPGHYGHRPVPEAGDSVTVYLKGDRTTGYDVLSPNGFDIAANQSSTAPR